jgi:hypothetical protein
MVLLSKEMSMIDICCAENYYALTSGYKKGTLLQNEKGRFAAESTIADHKISASVLQSITKRCNAGDYANIQEGWVYWYTLKMTQIDSKATKRVFVCV